MNTTALLALAASTVGVGLALGGSLLFARARVAMRTALTRRASAALARSLAASVSLLGLVTMGAGSAVFCAQTVPWRDPARSVAAATIGVAMFALAGALVARVADRTEEARVRPTGNAGPPGPVTDQRLSLPAAETPAAAGPPVAAPRGYDGSEPPSRPAGPPQGAASLTIGPVGAPAPGTQHVQTRPEEPGQPAPPATVTDAVAVTVDVRPGWIYRDQDGSWFMGVGTTSGRSRLLELPYFTLVGAGRPAYPLHTAGAGELAVVPSTGATDPGKPPGPAVPPGRPDSSERG